MLEARLRTRLPLPIDVLVIDDCPHADLALERAREAIATTRATAELRIVGKLGLDHFEGRSFPGWDHHISVVFCCFALFIAEPVRHFSLDRAA